MNVTLPTSGGPRHRRAGAWLEAARLRGGCLLRVRIGVLAFLRHAAATRKLHATITIRAR